RIEGRSVDEMKNFGLIRLGKFLNLSLTNDLKIVPRVVCVNPGLRPVSLLLCPVCITVASTSIWIGRDFHGSRTGYADINNVLLVINDLRPFREQMIGKNSS